MFFPPQLLDEIRTRLPVSQVVAKRVKLRRQGREYIGLSPFKVEKSPSFTVNDQKGFYHCFATGEHGDIFRFVMTMDGLTLPEAVERLAAEAGVAMPKSRPGAVKEGEQRQRLGELVEASAKFYEDQLKGPAGKLARETLERRKITAETRQKFRFGYAPEGRSVLKEHLARLGFSAADMNASGMLIHGEDIPVSYDRFRHRLMIPITDGKGNFSPEYSDCRPFIRQAFKHWLAGPRPNNELWVVPEQGTTIGYNLSCFPNIWQDTVVLGNDIKKIWNELLAE